MLLIVLLLVCLFVCMFVCEQRVDKVWWFAANWLRCRKTPWMLWMLEFATCRSYIEPPPMALEESVQTLSWERDFACDFWVVRKIAKELPYLESMSNQLHAVKVTSHRWRKAFYSVVSVWHWHSLCTSRYINTTNLPPWVISSGHLPSETYREFLEHYHYNKGSAGDMAQRRQEPTSVIWILSLQHCNATCFQAHLWPSLSI